MRDLYWTFRNFRNRVADFLRYRRVTANMDQRFADASPEDLARCDGICIICREDMSATSRNKKLSCSHVFHMHCLRFVISLILGYMCQVEWKDISAHVSSALSARQFLHQETLK